MEPQALVVSRSHSCIFGVVLLFYHRWIETALRLWPCFLMLKAIYMRYMSALFMMKLVDGVPMTRPDHFEQAAQHWSDQTAIDITQSHEETLE